jgi:BON domain
VIPLGKRSLVLVLAMAALTARAISQEIVIEPTNGNSQGKVRVSRPAASESTPAQPKSTAKPVAERPSTRNSAKAPAKGPAKKATLKQVSAKPKATPVEAVSAPEPPKIEAPAPVVKKMPARPQWALSDNRDANTLQSEIANALSRDPKLTGSSIQVKVDEESVTLAGQATGTEERLQAVRLAQSYAWNRKLLDKIDVVRGVSAQK